MRIRPPSALHMHAACLQLRPTSFLPPPPPPRCRRRPLCCCWPRRRGAVLGGARGPQLMVLSGFCLEMLEAAGRAPLDARAAIGRALMLVRLASRCWAGVAWEWVHVVGVCLRCV